MLKAKIWFGMLLSTDRPCASRSSGLVVPGCSNAGTTMSNSVLFSAVNADGADCVGARQLGNVHA